MTEKPSRRLPIWVFVLLGILIAVLISGFCVPLVIRSAEERRWAGMRQWCEEVAREVRSRDDRRPVLRGVALEGNAWDDYAVALEKLEWRDVLPLADVVSRRPSADLGKARTLLEKHAPAVSALRLGASRGRSHRDRDWEKGDPSLGSKINSLAYLSVCHARSLAEEGRRGEALELLLDTARFGEDVAFNGSYIDACIGFGPISLALDEIKDLILRGFVSTEESNRLARELDILDQGFPREGDAWRVEAMNGGFEYLRAETMLAVLKPLEIRDPGQPTWRYGFSDRLVLVDAFDSAVNWSRRFRRADGLSWSEALKIQQGLTAERGRTKNPLIQKLYGIQQSLTPAGIPDNAFRRHRARLRLILAVAAYREPGSIPVLDDPFGDKIRSSMTGARLRVWSVGKDGVDDGGVGEWNKGDSKDIVLEVDR